MAINEQHDTFTGKADSPLTDFRNAIRPRPVCSGQNHFVANDIVSGYIQPSRDWLGIDPHHRHTVDAFGAAPCAEHAYNALGYKSPVEFETDFYSQPSSTLTTLCAVSV